MKDIDNLIFYFSLNKNLEKCYIAKKNNALYYINETINQFKIINNFDEKEFNIIGLSFYNENEKCKKLVKML